MKKVHPIERSSPRTCNIDQPDWSKADSVFVQKVDGERVSLKEIVKDKKTVLVFMRRFDCPTCYTYAILFHHLRSVLERGDIKVVFITCSKDLNEVNVFIQSFAYYLNTISIDGIKPLPGELYVDLTRESYRYFGIGDTLSKWELFKLLSSLAIERRLGTLLTTREEGTSRWKKMSYRHTFLEIMNYIRLRMPLFVKQEGFGKKSILWQSPGIIVTNENQVTYKYVIKEQYFYIPSTPQQFVEEAFNISAEEIKDFDFQNALEDFVKALINKADYGVLKNNELILDKRVGHGKDADVFRSTWLGLPVAIKYLKSSVEVEATSSKSISPISSSLSTQNEYKIFSNEVAIMMGLRHQNIISIMGFGVDPPSLFIVMEYMEKGSLFSLLGSDQEISGEEKLRFSMNIADALAHMHDRNPPILHSDLKSLNILVDKDGVLKVSDFGISREMRRKYKTLFPEETDQEGLNSGNEGTIQWQPPETFTSTEYRPSKAQDMYAFGVILWEISTRRKPWKGTARRTIAENVCKGYRPLVLVSDKWSPEFEGLVNKCWNQSASKRPTFSRVKKMLKRIQTINEP